MIKSVAVKTQKGDTLRFDLIPLDLGSITKPGNVYVTSDGKYVECNEKQAGLTIKTTSTRWYKVLRRSKVASATTS